MAESNPLRLVSGALFDPFNPDVSVITLEDIATGLANSNRYAGQTRWPYSTAEHACNVWEAVKTKGGNLATQWKALHHDDSDAFLWDIPRPMKSHPQLAWLVARERFLQGKLYELFQCDRVGVVDEDLLHECDVSDRCPSNPAGYAFAEGQWKCLVELLGNKLGFSKFSPGPLDKLLRSEV